MTNAELAATLEQMAEEDMCWGLCDDCRVKWAKEREALREAAARLRARGEAADGVN